MQRMVLSGYVHSTEQFFRHVLVLDHHCEVDLVRRVIDTELNEVRHFPKVVRGHHEIEL